MAAKYSMRRSVVLYARRNVGLLSLIYLRSLAIKKLTVISDDEHIISFSKKNNIQIVDFESMGDFDLFICVHGNKIIEDKYIKPGRMVNIHPCLYKYKGHNPVKRYIENRDTDATVESHYITSVVDGGELIHREDFYTGEIKSYAEFYNIAYPFYIKCLDATIEHLNYQKNRVPKWAEGVIGNKYNRWTVLRYINRNGSHIYFECVCECGVLKITDINQLKNGNSKSCGCLRIDTMRSRATHGQSKKRDGIYGIWSSMKNRCYSKANPQYMNYGGRGIAVCDRWLGEDGFKNFVADVGERPTRLHSLDRYPDHNGNYGPNNVRWATGLQQQRNKRSNINITINGDTKCLSDWCIIYGVDKSTVKYRRNKLKWSWVKCLSTPPSRRGRNTLKKR